MKSDKAAIAKSAAQPVAVNVAGLVTLRSRISVGLSSPKRSREISISEILFSACTADGIVAHLRAAQAARTTWSAGRPAEPKSGLSGMGRREGTVMHQSMRRRVAQ